MNLNKNYNMKALQTFYYLNPKKCRSTIHIRRSTYYNTTTHVSSKRKYRKNNWEQEYQQKLIFDYESKYLQDLVQCVFEAERSFNLPRISACLERLMGTNVVRLTDRKYMFELRQRINENYRMQLLKRIRERELKEVERERILIIEGKTDLIPDELSDDPIFVVNKAASVEIFKKRSKLKTNRERNSERLKVQGLKWERERMQHEEEERQRLEELTERRKNQRELELRYVEEDAERGMNLLRIDNEDWRSCEQKLKEFLETERNRMKERSLRISTPFNSDPLDIQNIVRARQKFRETEHRIRQELEEKLKDDKTLTTTKELMVKSAASKMSKLLADEIDSQDQKVIEDQDSTNALLQAELDEEKLRRKYTDDASDVSSEPELAKETSTISTSKRRYVQELIQETESDVQRGLVISKEQYEHLRYQDDRIMQLRQAQDIRELYRLAEEIIIGERIEDETIEEEFGNEEEEQFTDIEEDN